MAENKFEDAVIAKLKTEGWTYRDDLSGVSTQALYEHWRHILNQNNVRKLDNVPLSDTEFENLKLELNKNKTPYDAQLLLAGSGGVGTLPLTRDDGTRLEIEIFYGDEVAGGQSRYEVVNQVTFILLGQGTPRRTIKILSLVGEMPTVRTSQTL